MSFTTLSLCHAMYQPMVLLPHDQLIGFSFWANSRAYALLRGLGESTAIIGRAAIHGSPHNG